MLCKRRRSNQPTIDVLPLAELKMFAPSTELLFGTIQADLRIFFLPLIPRRFLHVSPKRNRRAPNMERRSMLGARRSREPGAQGIIITAPAAWGAPTQDPDS